MVDDWIETDPFHRYPGVHRGVHLPAHIAEPRRARFVFYAGFRHEDWPAVALVHFAQHLADMPIPRVRGRDHPALAHPLVVNVVVHADDVDERLASTKFRLHTAE